MPTSEKIVVRGVGAGCELQGGEGLALSQEG